MPLIGYALAAALLSPAAPTVARSTGLPLGAAVAHLEAARAASGGGVGVEVLLAMGWVESRYQPDSVSRVQSGRRRTGRWRSTEQAGDGPWFCGVVQARAASWSDCLALRDVAHGYQRGADELRDWLRMVRGDLRAALRGHGCGWRGVEGECNHYDERVLRRANNLQGET